MMAIGSPLRLSNEAGNFSNFQLGTKGRIHLQMVSLYSNSMNCPFLHQKGFGSLHFSYKMNRPLHIIPYRRTKFKHPSFLVRGSANVTTILKSSTIALSRSYDNLLRCPPMLQIASAVGLISFTLWGFGPLLRHARDFIKHKKDNNWENSITRYVFISYIRPLLLWIGVILIHRALDPIVLSKEASQVIKNRILNFIRLLSTVLTFAYFLSRFIQQMQKLLLQNNESNGAQSMAFQFVSSVLYPLVWVAAASLFMELLGYSTQKWLTAGGLGTVLLTLAGREILTNFLSSLMIHATQPFVLNEWIQMRIDGNEVSGNVESIGWWTPTIIRGDDREAIHIPNHKFTVNIVRNLTQKTHWRVKTHLAISYLDADKISIIVADMRKVLSKNPQVEQQRLHRRVFLDFIEPENQSFMILISCFAKTSRFEEFLGIKGDILLDLLRIINHHGARLATPLRTIQKMYSNDDPEVIPFTETIIPPSGVHMNYPLYLTDSTTRMNNDNEENRPLKNLSKLDQSVIVLSRSSEVSNLENEQKLTVMMSKGEGKSDVSDPSNRIDVSDMRQPKLKSRVDGSDPVKLNSTSSNEPCDAAEIEKTNMMSPRNRSSSLEDNLVLGVALDGSKRTLPIEQSIDTESEGMATPQKGQGTSRKPEK